MLKKLLIAASAAVMSVSVLAAEAPATYNTKCAMCHATGAANAPKAGDKAAWETRLAAAGSVDALVASAVKGKNAMPPKGLCMDCTDEQLKEAVEFMIQ